MKIPCKNCLLIPRCRHKEYSPLMDECSTLCKLLYHHGTSDSRYRKRWWDRNVRRLEKILTPTQWFVDDIQISEVRTYTSISSPPNQEE